MSELHFLPFVTVLPICGVVLLILGLWKRGSNAQSTIDTPKKSPAIIYWGLALLAFTFIGWVFLYFAVYKTSDAGHATGAGEMAVFFLFLTAMLLLLLIPTLIFTGLVFLIRGFWLQSKDRKKTLGEKVQFKRNYIWGLCLIFLPCLLIPLIALGLEPLSAMVM